jgi:hypothetical protein
MIELTNHSNFFSIEYQNIFQELKRNLDSINPEKDYKTGLILKTDNIPTYKLLFCK